MSIVIKRQNAASALADAISAVLNSPAYADAKEAIAAAIAATRDASKIRDAAQSQGSNTWQAWLGAGKAIAATPGATPGIALALVNSVAGDDNTRSTIATYRSRVASLVPILAADDESFAALWREANIRKGGKPVPVPANRVFDNTQAAALIRAAKEKSIDAFQFMLGELIAHLRAEAKNDAPEGTEAEARRSRAAVRKANATALVERAMRAIGMEVPELPGTGEEGEDAGELPDVNAEPAQGEGRRVANG